MFQGHWIEVTFQQIFFIAPFLIGVHYMAHRTNLAVVILSKLLLVSCMKFML